MSLLKSFNCKKRGMGYAKVIHEKKKYWKNAQVSEILKIIGTQMPVMEKKKKKIEKINKIAHVFLQKVFQVSKTREICFKEHSRIRLATIYTYPHTCTSWSKSMTYLSLDPCFDFTIYAMQVCSHIYPYRSSI